MYKVRIFYTGDVNPTWSPQVACMGQLCGQPLSIKKTMSRDGRTCFLLGEQTRPFDYARWEGLNINT
jgi:hypothetical protein